MNEMKRSGFYPTYLPTLPTTKYWVFLGVGTWGHEDDKHIVCLHVNSLGLTKIDEPLVWVKGDIRLENASIGIWTLVQGISIPLIYLQTYPPLIRNIFFGKCCTNQSYSLKHFKVFFMKAIMLHAFSTREFFLHVLVYASTIVYISSLLK